MFPLQSSSNWIKVSLLLTLALLSGVWGLSQYHYTDPNTSPAANPLQESWDFSQTVGVYSFSADADQTMLPRAVPAMLGQTDVRFSMHIDGEVAQPNESKINLSIVGSGLDSTPVTMVQNGHQSYLFLISFLYVNT